VGPGRWSADKEEVFLAALEEGANVRRAARAARISTTALYTRRQREPAFAEAWAAAVRGGYLDVEALLIENAKAVLSNAPRPRRRGRLTDDLSVADAINILKLHRASAKGGAPQRYDWRAAEPDIEEVRAEVLRKVAAMERAGRV
jgi:transposase-like protein